uniref:Caspase 8 n=1 Tax=Callorhinchus milii TaxID=7868 RepID=A0A4W3GWK1_CALMI
MSVRCRSIVMQRLYDFRQLLFDVCEDITRKELPTVKNLLSAKLSKSELERITTMFDAVIEMEKKDLLSPDNTQTLEFICGQLGKDLLRRFSDYRQNCTGEGWSRTVMGTGDSLKSPIPERGEHRFQNSPSHDLCAVPDTMLNELSISDSHKGHGIEIQDCGTERTKALPQQNSGEAYRMDHEPRGYCVIINNQSFTNMRSRIGTDRDEDSLQEIFKWLKFQVKVYRDLTSEEMCQTLQNYQGEMQRDRDCFVCCVLSHGEKGIVFGTCGNKLRIRTLTTLFSASNCPLLRQKPKIFFIQACQGSRKQDGVLVQTDCETPAPTLAARLEEDAQRSSGPIIPDEADFLLGMATVEGYVSFRHVSEGTWYIQSLCANLRQHCPSNDLLSILTIVNRDVSEKQDGKYKTQMPQPSYTLRKKLFFLI